MDTAICDNCSEPISLTNFTLHQVHCLRFNIKCKYCERVVKKTGIQEHENQYHKIVECKCGIQIRKDLLEEHNKDCVCRQVICSFCEFPCEYKYLAEHESICKCRTDICDTCGIRFTLFELQKHNCNQPVVEYDCMLCEKLFISPELLQLHLQTEHFNE